MRFLNNFFLPFVLQLLRGCMWCPDSTEPGSRDPPSPTFPEPPSGSTTRQLLAFLHKLEDSKSIENIGILCEDLFNEWIDTAGDAKVESTDLTTFNGLISTIRELRRLSEQRHRRNAQLCREKQLKLLNMKINEKGQVAMATIPVHFQEATQLVDEPGLQCAICHEGPKAAPRAELGIYTYIRRTRLEEALIAEEVAATTSSKSANEGAQKAGDGYTTVSSFIVVHFDCHSNSVRTAGGNEWTVATKFNREAKCNSLLPVLMNEVKRSNVDGDGEKEKENGQESASGQRNGNKSEDESKCSMSELYAKRVTAHNVNVSVSFMGLLRFVMRDWPIG